MLHIGERITQLRKQHHLSQEELAKRAQVSRTIIGNYERNTNTPSIEVLVKLARVFNVTVDYLIGEGQLSSLDKDTIKRIEDIENLSEENKNFVLKMIDMAIQNFKTKQAFGWTYGFPERDPIAHQQGSLIRAVVVEMIKPVVLVKNVELVLDWFVVIGGLIHFNECSFFRSNIIFV